MFSTDPLSVCKQQRNLTVVRCTSSSRISSSAQLNSITVRSECVLCNNVWNNLIFFIIGCSYAITGLLHMVTSVGKTNDCYQAAYCIYLNPPAAWRHHTWTDILHPCPWTFMCRSQPEGSTAHKSTSYAPVHLNGIGNWKHRHIIQWLRGTLCKAWYFFTQRQSLIFF